MRSVLIFSVLLIITSITLKTDAQTITLGTVVAAQGDNVLVPVDFYDLDNVGAITLFVAFDTTVLTYTGYTNLSPEGAGTISYYDPENSRVGFSWVAGMSGVDFPDGKYLDLQFIFHGGYSDLIFPADCEIATFSGVVINVNYVNGSVSSPQVTFNLKVFLEGPYIQGSGGIMHTNLQDAGPIPGSQPFAPQLPYFGNDNPAWYYPGTENVTTLPPGTVDWVLVELRDAASAVEATGSATVCRKPCFLLNDGNIVDEYGDIPVFYASFSYGAFVVVWHRNHLGIMSSQPAQGFGNSYAYDFTTSASKVAGGITGYTEIENGIWGMSAGDINADKVIDIQDETAGWETEAGKDGYYGADTNLDTQVDNPDKNDLLIKNDGKFSGVPD